MTVESSTAHARPPDAKFESSSVTPHHHSNVPVSSLPEEKTIVSQSSSSSLITKSLASCRLLHSYAKTTRADPTEPPAPLPDSGPHDTGQTPDSVDMELRARDDCPISTTTSPVTVTKQPAQQSSPHHQRSGLQPVRPLFIVADHSLSGDWPLSAISPGNCFMYESDPLEDHNKVVLSPTLSSTGQDPLQSPLATSMSSSSGCAGTMATVSVKEEESVSLSDMSLWNQIVGDYLLQDLESGGQSLQDIGDELAALTSPTTTTVPMVTTTSTITATPLKEEPPGMDSDSLGALEASFQVGLKDEKVTGPTLAQLNDRESVLDRFVSPLPHPPTTAPQTPSSHSTVRATQDSGTCTAVTKSKPSVTSHQWPEDPTTAHGNQSAPATVTKASWASSSATLASLQQSVQPATSIVTHPFKPTSQNHEEPSSTQDLTTPEQFTPRLFSNPRQQAESNLQQLLLGNTAAHPRLLPGVAVQNAAPRFAVKQEILSPMTTTVATQEDLTPSLTTTTTTTMATPSPSTKATTSRGKKRKAESPTLRQDSGESAGSMEKKWEEIRCYLDSNKRGVSGLHGDEATGKSDKIAEMMTTTHSNSLRHAPPPAKRAKPSHVQAALLPSEEPPHIKQEHDSDFDNSDDELSDVESNASYGSFVDEILHGNALGGGESGSRRGGSESKRYFWQYNTQSKGPKGKRLCKSMQEQDPHFLADFEDPVFQPDVQDARYKHNGKARKGDGNDITPSPWKLFQIGNELQKLNKKINILGEMEKPTPRLTAKDTASVVTSCGGATGGKSKSRKEKNKYASRACRLKKKAQHEANKVKLYGLENEHHQLMDVLRSVKTNIHKHIKDRVVSPNKSHFTNMLERQVKDKLTMMIAGNTADYVNSVLQKVAEGDRSGGITLEKC